MKKLILVLLVALFVVGIASASYWLWHFQVEAEVLEPISLLGGDVHFDGYPSDFFTKNVTITNAAPHNVSVTLSWNETSNPANVLYETNLPIVLAAETGDTEINCTWNISNDSPPGTFIGYVEVLR